MKKKALLLSLMCIVFVGLTAQNAKLTITSNPNQKFWLFINDILQNEYSIHSIQIDGLQQTDYKMRIEMDNPTGNILGQTVEISHINNENSYRVVADRMGNFQFQKSKQATRPSIVQEVVLPDYNYQSYYLQYIYPGFNSNIDYGQYKGKQHREYQNYGQNFSQNQFQQNNKRRTKVIHSMPDADFEKALKLLKEETFDSRRVDLAKQIISANPLRASQITEICKVFDYESRKLEIAKFAYPYCVDKNNYFFVNEAFGFSSSKSSLAKFISEQQ